MSISDSVVEALLNAVPQLRSQVFFKASLTALSHAMEDQVLAGMESPLVIASFQQERFYRQEASRYRRIAALSEHVYVLSAPDTSFEEGSGYETIAFGEDDELVQEWHLLVVSAEYQACLICRERAGSPAEIPGALTLDQTRRFEGVWTQEPEVCYEAAKILLARILAYRPALSAKINEAQALYLDIFTAAEAALPQAGDPFTQRLVTYLQAGQYKLLKAYKALSIKERQERLINSVTAAIRRSLNPDELFRITVEELGQALPVDRCVIYRCLDQDVGVIRHEYHRPEVRSLLGAVWPLADNPLIELMRRSQDVVAVSDTHHPEAGLQTALDRLNYLIEEWQIHGWALVPLVYQQRFLGMIELHHCQAVPPPWSDHELTLVEAVAAQLSVAIIQADAYAHLQDLNQQLEALEQTRSNLIAITGHELRTPLSTIQVCLESLATEPDMPEVLQQTMLTSALEDAERMRKLVQDFLTLSQLESGRIAWNLEPISVAECISLALSGIQARRDSNAGAEIQVHVPPRLPMVCADGEWLVEVIIKLLDNACKFTAPEDVISITVRPTDAGLAQVTIADTGRGIEPYRLETVFDRFYQEEGALRRTTGGTGLGLAMCRQIVEGMGGTIWAASGGKNQGSQFHFTLPISGVQPLTCNLKQTVPTRDKAVVDSGRSRRNPYIL